MGKLEDIKHETEDAYDHLCRAEELITRARVDADQANWALEEMRQQLHAILAHLSTIHHLTSEN